MTFSEIIARINTEQIRLSDIVRHSNRRPEWLGKVEFFENEENPRSKDEWANHSAIMHLADHGLYLRAHGVKDGGVSGDRKWRYDLTVVERKTEEVPARAAYTVVRFDTIYPTQHTEYPDATVAFPSYYEKQDAAEKAAAA